MQGRGCAPTRGRFFAVGRLRVDADGGCRCIDADHPATRSFLVFGVEGRGRARRTGGERWCARSDRDPPARDLGTGRHAARRPHRRACPGRPFVRRRRWEGTDRHDLCRQRCRCARRGGRAAEAGRPACRPGVRRVERGATPAPEPPGADLRGRRRAASGARPPARPRARHGCGGRAPVGPGPAGRRAARQRVSSSTSWHSPTGSTRGRSARRRAGGRVSRSPTACTGWRCSTGASRRCSVSPGPNRGRVGWRRSASRSLDRARS